MNRGGKGIAMLLALSLLVLPCAALAQSYSFPSAGVFVEMQPDWTLLCPQTLGEEEELLAQPGGGCGRAARGLGRGGHRV